MTISTKPTEQQYLEVCDMDDCNQVLHEDIPIHIWEKKVDGSNNPLEIVICDCCHQELEDSLREKGWIHDADEDEDEEEEE